MAEDGEDLLALEAQVCFALAVASRRVIALYRPVLEPLGLTHPQYLVMLALWQHGPLTLAGLSTLVHQEPPTLSPMVKRLESLGYLVRERDPDDDRALRLVLTERGRALREQALDIPPTMLARLGMDAEQLAALNGVLADLIRAGDLADTNQRARVAHQHRLRPTTARTR